MKFTTSSWSPNQNHRWSWWCPDQSGGSEVTSSVPDTERIKMVEKKQKLNKSSQHIEEVLIQTLMHSEKIKLSKKEQHGNFY